MIRDIFQPLTTPRTSRIHALLVFLALAACSRAPTEPGGGATATPSAASSIAAAPAPTAPIPKRDLPLLWSDPPNFVRSNPKSPARAAEYVVPRVGSDPEDAECVVMTF